MLILLLELSKLTCISINDITSTLDFNGLLKQNENQEYQIIIEKDHITTTTTTSSSSSSGSSNKKKLYAKGELLTWVPYMVAAKGDAGILNIPREYLQQPQTISTSDISKDAIISTTRRKKRLTRSAVSNNKKK